MSSGGRGLVHGDEPEPWVWGEHGDELWAMGGSSMVRGRRGEHCDMNPGGEGGHGKPWGERLGGGVHAIGECIHGDEPWGVCMVLNPGGSAW